MPNPLYPNSPLTFEERWALPVEPPEFDTAVRMPDFDAERPAPLPPTIPYSLVESSGAPILMPVDYDPFEAAAIQTRKRYENRNRVQPSTYQMDNLINRAEREYVNDLNPSQKRITEAFTALDQFNDNRRGPTDKLFGLTGERYQTWPEKMIRSAVTLPAEVASGAVASH